MSLLLVLALAAPAAADPGKTFHGTLDGASFTCGGDPVSADVPEVTGGVWNLAVAGQSGTITINVFYDGSHHLSFGAPGGVVTDTDPLTVQFWGGAATAIVDGDDFTWSVPDLGYACPGEVPYDALTYSGEVDR